jgi:immune inhibitor A
MSTSSKWLDEIKHVHAAARASDDGSRCTVAPSPELRERIQQELAGIRASSTSLPFIRVGEPQRPGLNDGLIIPPEEFPLGTPMSMMRDAAAERAPLAGVVRVIVVLVDFTDKHMAQTAAHYQQLFFSTGVIPTKSVREYYTDVTHGIIDIQGQVVGPFRMPRTLAAYAHGASGLGSTLPNAATMAKDALVAADPTVNFAPFDNNGDGFVDAFIVIHAGAGAEVTGSSGDIWSHKWTLDGGARTVDGTKVFGYLTVPEDAKIGVCCHELGHLLFGFPDLYDTDGTSEGIGNWCLMAAGSWGGGGDTPVHPSAWCKANQGWASVDNRTANGSVSFPDVKTSHNVVRLWKDGAPSSEYFLVENRQQTGFDASLPGPGLLVWHVDESIAGNTNEAHPKIALLQADAKRDLELNHNRGDSGDPYPGSSSNTAVTNTSTPNTKSYSAASTCVTVTSISASSAVMTANVQVKCKVIKEAKELTKDTKDLHKDKELSKDVKDSHKEKEVSKDTKDSKDIHKEKEITKDSKDAHKEIITDKPLIDKRAEKPITDKSAVLDKPTDIPHGGFDPGGLSSNPAIAALEQRLSNVEALLSQIASSMSGGGMSGGGMSGGGMTGGSGGTGGATGPFISQDLRPDLRRGALMGEADAAGAQADMQQGSASAKRQYDKSSEH